MCWSECESHVICSMWIVCFHTWTWQLLGPVSISDKTAYRKISQSLEAARFAFRIVRSLWNLFARHLGSSACQISKWYQNFNTQSRAFETLRDLTIRRFIVYWNGSQLAGYEYVTHDIDVVTRAACTLQSEYGVERDWYSCMMLNSDINFAPISTWRHNTWLD